MTDASKRHSRDYLERTIETVRVHRDAENSWPQWANIFADEIERLWAIEEQYAALEREIESGVPGRLTVIVPEDRWNELKRVEEQFDAMRDKLDSLYAGYSAKCERFSLGTCDRSADDGQLCRICQFFLGIGWESFEVTSGGLRSWRPVSNPAKRDEA